MEDKKLVEFENGTKFALIKEFELDGTKYFFAAGVNEEETEGNGVYCYFKEEIKDGNKYLYEERNPEILKNFKVTYKDFE